MICDRNGTVPVLMLVLLSILFKVTGAVLTKPEWEKWKKGADNDICFSTNINQMRKLVLGLAVSLDGFIEGPNGEYDWCFTDQDYGLNDFFKRIDATFIGRKSYEMLQTAEGGTDWMPKLQEYVFSNTLTHVKENAVIVSGDVIAQAKEIKMQPGKDIWLFGGASLTSAMLEHGLVDELWLSIHPILLGSGKPLFQNGTQRIPLKLEESRTYDTGLVSVKYSIVTS